MEINYTAHVIGNEETCHPVNRPVIINTFVG